MGVMSVLSFSDVQYVGEQSRGTKTVEGILEESTLLQVDCARSKAGDNLSLSVCDKKQILLDDDYSRQVPNADHSDENHRKDDCLTELNCAPRRSMDELLSDDHVTKKPSSKVDEKVNKTHEECSSFSKTVSPRLADCKESNVEEVVYGDELGHFRRTESHSSFGYKDNKNDNCVGEELGVHVMESFFELNNCSLPIVDGERDGITEGEEVDAPCNADSILSNTSNSHAENEDTPSALKELSDLACRADFEHGDLFGERKDNKYLSVGCIPHPIMQITEYELQNRRNQEGESALPGTECAEHDLPVALWVKWRGKWQTGIRCQRTDCPLTTLRAKPTHERKKYIAVFFPRAKKYSWVDMLLVCSIDESPEPLAYGTHRKWRKLVKDMTIPRRYIMQKLSIAMLNINDQLHTEAVIENARKATTWKEFAMEASHCREYSELGRMLLKLRNMILDRYISHDWLENSFDSWLQRCHSAQSAESIEILTEELVGSVSWNEVDELWNAPVQPELGPEWKTWKQEVKWFFTSQPKASRRGTEQRDPNTLGVGSQISRKRPKLEVRQAETCASQMEASGSRIISLLNEIDSNSGLFSGEGILESTQSCEPKLMHSPVVGMPTDGGSNKTITGDIHLETDITNKYRQCIAFMEAKGRQCGRWASDGDIYCCVHLNSHSLGKPSHVCQEESCVSQMEASSSRILSQLNDIDSNAGHSNGQGILESTLSCERKLMLSPEVGMTTDGGSNKTATADVHRETDITNKYRQCSAFIESKGRQCGRWANDGDIYCCVHLSNHSLGKPSQEELTLPIEASMCEGMTTHGNKCKHRARLGSQFCKKHRLQRSDESFCMNNHLSSSGNKLKRKYDQDKILEIASSSNITNCEEYGLAGGVQTPIQDKLIPIVNGETLYERNCLMNKSELYNASPTPMEGSSPDTPHCIGYYYQNNGEQCLEHAKLHTLYCEKHLPKFLKRARNGKSRLISKDVFTNLLRSCSSRKQKLYLHRASELLYGFMRSNLSRQKPASKSDSIRWILSEASKDLDVGEYLLKLVLTEREKITSLWGFDAGKGKQTSSLETDGAPLLDKHENHGNEMIVKCKFCGEGFSDDKKLGAHWTEFHKKEARWLFRGYACAVCMNSFTNRKVLETHVKERHDVQFLEHSVLFRCMSCSSHFVNPEQLWEHVLSCHLMEFRMPNTTQQHNHIIPQPVQPKTELGNLLSNGISEKEDGSQKYTCRFCGLRFDLLPDLGRHHQVAHMNPISNSYVLPKRGNNNLKRTRHCHPGFKKKYTSTFTYKNQSSVDMQKNFQFSNSAFSVRPQLETKASETVALGRLLESHCSYVAETLFSQIQKTKSRPSNLEILSIARSACCKISLHAALEVKYGILPENLYLKAAKLCCELNIEVDWHLEEFICPKGCMPLVNKHSIPPLKSLSDGFEEPPTPKLDSMSDSKWEMDESHFILHPKHFNWKPRRKVYVLCEDVSFGKESVPVVCVLDEDLKNSLHIDSDEASYFQELGSPIPWQGFTYVTERLIEPSLSLDTKNSQLGCACPHPKCYPEKCDHVYLFDNDYENAEDIHGKSMHGRFPYDERGRILLEEGRLVYECNSSCNCDSTCQNRVLQKGIQVRVEIFRTENKGWAVRAGEAISRGTFVCEYIGEVLSDVDANKSGERYDSVGCSYLYDIDAHIDGARGWSEQSVPYVIDATKYGNVSRFINHSCSPNLVNHLVLVESMDCQLAHIGLYASQDIAAGEELAYDYRYKLLPGDGRPCHCGSPNCRGRLY